MNGGKYGFYKSRSGHSKKEPENKSKLSVVEIIVVMKDIATILLATYQWLK